MLSFIRAKVITITLVTSVLFVIAYALAVRSTGLTSSVMAFRPKQSVLTEPMKEEMLIQKLGHVGKELKTKKKQRTNLVEDMMQCSLVMGMSREELRRNKLNFTTVASKAKIFLTALQSIIPAKFLRDIKSPCWYYNLSLSTSLRRVPYAMAKGLLQMSGGSRDLYCLPYFFIAGFPKSGTTTMHKALQEHPQIIRPQRKEPHWWTRVSLKDMNIEHLRLTVVKYLLYFNEASKIISQNLKGGTITYDGSQSTLWDSNFYLENEDYCAMPAIVSRILPNAKFIVVMRNPVTREYSDFFNSCGKDMKTWPKPIVEDPAGQFHKELQTNTAAFTNCLKSTNNSMHECIRQMRSITNACGRRQRFPISLYYIHLHKWLQFYPKENFLFLRTEDMSQQPSTTMNRITDFLEIDPVSKDQAQEWLCHKANVQTAFTSDPEKYEMKPETKKMLKEFYRPFNEKLVELIGSERFLWTNKQ